MAQTLIRVTVTGGLNSGAAIDGEKDRQKIVSPEHCGRSAAMITIGHIGTWLLGKQPRELFQGRTIVNQPDLVDVVLFVGRLKIATS